MESIKILVGNKCFQPLIGKLWIVDMKNMSNQLLSLSKDHECLTCSQKREEITLQYSSPVCGTIPEITPKQARQATDAILIDVREVDEWNEGHIDGAEHVALSELSEGNIPDFSKDKNIIIYCRSGVRSLKAAYILRSKGYLNVSNMTGGYIAWTEDDQFNSTQTA